MSWGNRGGDGGPWGRPPGGGNGGGGGGMPPGGPDFDQMFRRGQDTFKKMFDNGPDATGFGVGLVFAALMLVWLLSGVYFVRADEQGVETRLGAYTVTTQPGVHYHLPWPIETATMLKVTTINKVEAGFRSGYSSRRNNGSESSIPEESLMLTGDENIVDINFEVQWKIASARDFLFNLRNPEQTVKAVSESAMREVVGQHSFTALLLEDSEPRAEGETSAQASKPRQQGRKFVEDSTLRLIQSTLDAYNAGIEILKVNMLKAAPPAQVSDAFRDVQSARVDMETRRNEAEAYANDIIPRARGEALKIVLDAEAYKQEVLARSVGEAARFSAVHEQYKQAKDVTRKRIYLETMEEILQGMNKLVVDRKGGSGVLPYLPLSELKPKQPAAEEAKAP